MLQRVCRWADSEDASHLYWNYGCIGVVRLQLGGKWTTLIMWRGKDHTATAGSRAQGKRWVERWVSVQRGLPKAPRKVR